MALLSHWIFRIHNARVAQYYRREFSNAKETVFSLWKKSILKRSCAFSVSAIDDWSNFGSVLVERLVTFSRDAHKTYDTLDCAGHRLDLCDRWHCVRILGPTNTFQDDSFRYRWVVAHWTRARHQHKWPIIISCYVYFRFDFIDTIGNRCNKRHSRFMVHKIERIGQNSSNFYKTIS